MCDHCKTYKPMLEESIIPYNLQTSYARDRPTIPYNLDTSYARDRPTISEKPKTNATESGCCSWRQTCCDGGCCSRVGNCCSTGAETQNQGYQKPPPPPPPSSASYGYGYGYGYGSLGMMGLLPMTLDPAMPDRVPCKREEKNEPKLPMCYGGDCNDSSSDVTEKENDVSMSMPRQSER